MNEPTNNPDAEWVLTKVPDLEILSEPCESCSA